MVDLVAKPKLTYKVNYISMHGVQGDFHCANTTRAISFAVMQLSSGSTHVGIFHWQNEKWEPDTEATADALARIGGNGKNMRAVTSLSQLAEFNTLLIKEAGSKRGPNMETVRLWLEEFYRSARALNVIPGALDTARGLVYNPPQKVESKP